MNQERIDRLFSCRNEQGFDSISYDKRKILEDLYKDSDIIEILNNEELQAVNACPEDYYNVNIIKFVVYEIFIKNKFCFRSGSWVGEDFEIVDIDHDCPCFLALGNNVFYFGQACPHFPLGYGLTRHVQFLGQLFLRYFLRFAIFFYLFRYVH